MDKQRIQQIIQEIDQEERTAPGATATEIPEEEQQTYPYGNVSPFANMSKDDLLRLIAHLILAEEHAPIVDSYPPTSVNNDAQGYASTLEEETTVPPPTRKPLSKRMLMLLAVSALLVGSVGGYFFVPLFHQSATITITPTEQTVSTNVTITAGPGTKDAQAIQARFLPALHQTRQQTIPTTGTGHQNATYAHGMITFYNGLPQAQIITANTQLTGADGVHIVTDAAITIPAAILPTEGIATVKAHATTPGTQGNVRGSDIHGQCCLPGILAYNAPFYGGDNERDFHVATTTDITTATTTVKTHITQDVQRAITNQLAPGEAALPPQCTTSVTSNHKAGEEAQDITITVEETCQAATYSQPAFVTVATNQLQSQADNAIGQPTHLQGEVHTAITTVTMQGTILTIHANVSGIYRHTFTGYTIQHLQEQIAHMPRNQAEIILLQTPGIAYVNITSTQDTLPPDKNAIHIIVA